VEMVTASKYGLGSHLMSDYATYQALARLPAITSHIAYFRLKLMSSCNSGKPSV
jgi:hypothetical protein